ncbi:MAG: arginine deiminase-related protein [Sphingomicrobium sp.]
MGEDSQSSDAVLMVRPAAFGFNPETAATNVFAAAVATECAVAALAEFDRAAERLCAAGVDVLVLEDLPDPAKPDAAFPNNWVSFHADGTLALYPMAAPTRRLERRVEPLVKLLEARGFAIRRLIDLSAHEKSDRFLEGTGSLVLNRPGRRAYAALGPRTDRQALAEFDRRLGYSTFTFDAADATGRPVYHTNVMMSLGTRFAMLCLDVVAPGQRQALADDIEAGGRSIIEVDYEQLRCFACNIIELRTPTGKPLVALSAASKDCLRADQLGTLERLGGQLVDIAIPTIEAVSGGSLRCMIADIHSPRVSRGS